MVYVGYCFLICEAFAPVNTSYSVLSTIKFIISQNFHRYFPPCQKTLAALCAGLKGFSAVKR